ncbi:MAG: ferrochelatase, partial [Terriglobales bacterium]
MKVRGAVLLVSFGGPERAEDVVPFLDRVLRGRNVPAARRDQVAEHYFRMGGRSPLNAANRAIIAALERELDRRGLRLPVYFGNRNWHPLLEDTLRTMAADGVGHALALVTSAFGSYSSCRQYMDDMARARAAVGRAAPRLEKIRLFFNHPGFIAIQAERLRAALEHAGGSAELIFTAHGIPLEMAAAAPY